MATGKRRSSCFRKIVWEAARHVRSSVLLFVGVFVLLASLQVAASLLLRIPPDSILLFLLYIRQGLPLILKSTQWISPFSCISKASVTMAVGFVLRPLWFVVYFSFLIALSMLVIKLKGGPIRKFVFFSNRTPFRWYRKKKKLYCRA